MNSTRVVSAPGQMSLKSLVASSIGKKIWVAVTGILLFGWLCGHLVGNLQIFIGQDQLNAYAQKLKDLAGIVWVIRIVMIGLVLTHVFYGINLWYHNRKARPVRYSIYDTIQATLASRTMIWTGLTIFAFVVYHLLHFTFLVTNPDYVDLHDSMGRHDVYSMVILGFKSYIRSGVYVLAMVLLAVHLSHAISSFFQTLGWNKKETEPKLKALAYIVAVLIFVGYTSIPVAVLTGFITLPGGGH